MVDEIEGLIVKSLQLSACSKGINSVNDMAMNYDEVVNLMKLQELIILYNFKINDLIKLIHKFIA